MIKNLQKAVGVTADGIAGRNSGTRYGAAIRWAGGTPPTPTSVSGKRDTFPFFCVDGASWQNGGMNA